MTGRAPAWSCELIIALPGVGCGPGDWHFRTEQARCCTKTSVRLRGTSSGHIASSSQPLRKRGQSRAQGSSLIHSPSHVAAKTVRASATYYVGGAGSEVVSLHKLLARRDWHRTS
ncbi:hypothetical protein BC628DRAFT_568341 [Trametes gibbosa]|nr:hypothetical protein BC628DRAFT_568341 [Trametes gibbosa]